VALWRIDHTFPVFDEEDPETVIRWDTESAEYDDRQFIDPENPPEGDWVYDFLAPVQAILQNDPTYSATYLGLSPVL
jgi:hypothetical protein